MRTLHCMQAALTAAGATLRVRAQGTGSWDRAIASRTAPATSGSDAYTALHAGCSDGSWRCTTCARRKALAAGAVPLHRVLHLPRVAVMRTLHCIPSLVHFGGSVRALPSTRETFNHCALGNPKPGRWI
jgi:hypothetical protein